MDNRDYPRGSEHSGRQHDSTRSTSSENGTRIEFIPWLSPGPPNSIPTEAVTLVVYRDRGDAVDVLPCLSLAACRPTDTGERRRPDSWISAVIHDVSRVVIRSVERRPCSAGEFQNHLRFQRWPMVALAGECACRKRARLPLKGGPGLAWAPEHDRPPPRLVASGVLSSQFHARVDLAAGHDKGVVDVHPPVGFGSTISCASIIRVWWRIAPILVSPVLSRSGVLCLDTGIDACPCVTLRAAAIVGVGGNDRAYGSHPLVAVRNAQSTVIWALTAVHR